MRGRKEKTSTTKLPKTLREEFNLDITGPNSITGGTTLRRGNGRHATAAAAPTLDRKARRKQERLSKRTGHGSNNPQRSSSSSNAHVSQKKIRAEPPPSPSPSDLDEESEFSAPSPSPPPPPPPQHRDPPKSILKKPKPPRSRSRSRSLSPRPHVHVRKAVRDRLAEDDAEIEYLERKLKIKNKKLPKSFAEDGLDFLLEGLESGVVGDEVKAGKKRKRVEEEIAKELDEDEDEGEHSDGFDDSMGVDGDGNSSEDSSSSFRGFSPTPEPQTPKTRENPYLPGTTSVTSSVPSKSKYIPPSLRKSSSEQSEQTVRLQRQTKGLLNRLSEANIIQIFTEIETLYRANPRHDVTASISDNVLGTVCDRSSMQDTFMILHAGFIAGIYKLVGTDFGAHVVQRTVEEFEVHYQKSSGPSATSATAVVAVGKECTNLMSFLSELYNFQVVGCGLMFDYIRMFLEEITELNTELLLKIVRNSGSQLRSDDPGSLKDIIQMLQPAIAKAGPLSTRTKFMIETLTNLKNNRLKSATASSALTASSTHRMKKLLGSLNARQLRASEPLRASLADIRNTETKGKWWLVGASWVGNTHSSSNPATITNTEDNSTRLGPEKGNGKEEGEEEEEYIDLNHLAHTQRMNTSVRRAIFITIMSSPSATSAQTRLQKLHLTRTQSLEIPRVLIHCCGAEQTYNEFYTQLARILCSSQRPLKVAFTYCLWNLFGRFGEDQHSSSQNEGDGDDDDDEEAVGTRRIVNLARFYAGLVVSGNLSLTMLKTLKLPCLKSCTVLFLEMMFGDIFLAFLQRGRTGDGGDDAQAKQKEKQEEALLNLFMQLPNDNLQLVRGILWFLKKVFKSSDPLVAVEKEEEEAVRRGVEVACMGLNEILKRA